MGSTLSDLVAPGTVGAGAANELSPEESPRLAAARQVIGVLGGPIASLNFDFSLKVGRFIGNAVAAIGSSSKGARAEALGGLLVGIVSIGADLVGLGEEKAGVNALGEAGAAAKEIARAAQETAKLGEAAEAPGKQFLEGAFSVSDWTGYPSTLEKPSGPFRLLSGEEYETARAAANKANTALRAADPERYAGKHIHEIHPVKYGGSPTDPANKATLSPAEHAPFTTFWNRLMRAIR